MTDVLAQSIAAIIQHLGAYPILLFLALMGLAPWIMMIWAVRQQDKRLSKVFDRQDKRFEQVVQMYEDNVALVKNYEGHVQEQRDMSNKLMDLITISTSTQQTLVDYIRNNWWCPAAKDPALLSRLKETKQ